jgi:hypothetical protein
MVTLLARFTATPLARGVSIASWEDSLKSVRDGWGRAVARLAIEALEVELEVTGSPGRQYRTADQPRPFSPSRASTGPLLSKTTLNTGRESNRSGSLFSLLHAPFFASSPA